MLHAHLGHRSVSLVVMNRPPDKSSAPPLAPTSGAQQRQAPDLPRMPLLQNTRQMQYVALHPINKNYHTH